MCVTSGASTRSSGRAQCRTQPRNFPRARRHLSDTHTRTKPINQGETAVITEEGTGNRNVKSISAERVETNSTIHTTTRLPDCRVVDPSGCRAAMPAGLPGRTPREETLPTLVLFTTLSRILRRRCDRTNWLTAVRLRRLQNLQGKRRGDVGGQNGGTVAVTGALGGSISLPLCQTFPRC